MQKNNAKKKTKTPVDMSCYSHVTIFTSVQGKTAKDVLERKGLSPAALLVRVHLLRVHLLLVHLLLLTVRVSPSKLLLICFRFLTVTVWQLQCNSYDEMLTTLPFMSYVDWKLPLISLFYSQKLLQVELFQLIHHNFVLLFYLWKLYRGSSTAGGAFPSHTSWPDFAFLLKKVVLYAFNLFNWNVANPQTVQPLSCSIFRPSLRSKVNSMTSAAWFWQQNTDIRNRSDGAALEIYRVVWESTSRMITKFHSSALVTYGIVRADFALR